MQFCVGKIGGFGKASPGAPRIALGIRTLPFQNSNPLADIGAPVPEHCVRGIRERNLKNAGADSAVWFGMLAGHLVAAALIKLPFRTLLAGDLCQDISSNSGSRGMSSKFTVNFAGSRILTANFGLGFLAGTNSAAFDDAGFSCQIATTHLDISRRIFLACHVHRRQVLINGSNAIHRLPADPQRPLAAPPLLASILIALLC